MYCLSYPNEQHPQKILPRAVLHFLVFSSDVYDNAVSINHIVPVDALEYKESNHLRTQNGFC